jgi:hypothetical protein
MGRKNKKAGSDHCLLMITEGRASDVGLGLAQTLDAVAFLPLASLLEQVHALEALEDVAFDRAGGGIFEAGVLGHGGRPRSGDGLPDKRVIG